MEPLSFMARNAKAAGASVVLLGIMPGPCSSSTDDMGVVCKQLVGSRSYATQMSLPDASTGGLQELAAAVQAVGPAAREHAGGISITSARPAALHVYAHFVDEQGLESAVVQPFTFAWEKGQAKFQACELQPLAKPLPLPRCITSGRLTTHSKDAARLLGLPPARVHLLAEEAAPVQQAPARGSRHRPAVPQP